MTNLKNKTVIDDYVTSISLDKETYSDERGWVINPLRAADLIGVVPYNFHVASMQPGTSRGNHKHKHSTEWLLIFNGKCRFSWLPIDNDNSKELAESIVITEPTMLIIAPGTPHLIENISEKTVFLFAFNDSVENETITEKTPIEV